MSLMEAYQARDISPEEIYRLAPSRQLQLVSVCFDACLQATGLGNGVKAADFYSFKDPVTAAAQELEAARMNMEDFLKRNSENLYIVDGGIKSRRRFAEKAQTRNGHLHVSDVNRLMILSKDVASLDSVAEKINDSTEHTWQRDKDLTQVPWERHVSGFVMRQANYFIDGIPLEICQREARHFWLCRVATHPVYCMVRMPVDDIDKAEEFCAQYEALPETVSQAALRYHDDIQAADQPVLQEVIDNLRDIVVSASCEGLESKKQALRGFQRQTHLLFEKGSPPEWQELYQHAKKSVLQTVVA